MRFCLLIMAKSPVPGQVKTRLCPPLTPAEAADVAAASLLDTVEAALSTPGAVPVVALAGLVRRADVRDALAECVVIPQRGWTFADRLVHAHADVARYGLPVLQIGMDTPQVTPALLESCAEFDEAALGVALDGGWWALGLRDPRHAEVLRDVRMSRADTGVRTLEALRALRVTSAHGDEPRMLDVPGGLQVTNERDDKPHTLHVRGGLQVKALPVLSDVDTIADARAVAAQVPQSRFAAALAAASAVAR